MGLTLAIDQSTQGTKVLLVNPDGTIAYKTVKAHRQIVSESGWISHDLNEIAANLKVLIHASLAHTNGQSITGVAISNQRETAAAWRKTTGQPLALAIVWQDNRAAALVQALSTKSAATQVKEITGLALSPYFTAAKYAWLLKHEPAVQSAAAQGDLCFGTIDSWLIAQLTGGHHLTEPSNACRTQLMNLATNDWDPAMCALFGIDVSWLPQIIDSNGQFGTTDLFGELATPIPIISVLGDSQAALFAENCLAPGQFKVTFGTGSSVMLSTGSQLITTPTLNTSVAWRRNGQTTYALEGNVNYSGAIISWLKNNLHLIADPVETDAMATAANPADTTMLIPAFSGLAAPYNEPNLKAALIEMTALTGRNEVVRAGLNAIVAQITDITQLLTQFFPGIKPPIHVDGGMIANTYLMQRLADIVQLPVAVSPIQELSGVGAAMNGTGDSGVNLAAQQTYQPTMSPQAAATIQNKWHQEISRLVG